jgi:hypothetical protein
MAHSGNISSSDATLTTSLQTIATIAGIEIKAKITNYNTDENVKQTPKTDNANRPLMMINGGTSAGEQTSTSMFSTGIYANANSKIITASGFIKSGSDDTSVLLAGGGAKALSTFKIGDYLPLAGGTMSGTIFNIGGVGGNVGGRNAIGTGTGTNLDFVIGHSGEDYANARMLLFDQRYIHLHPKVRVGSYGISTTPSYTLEVEGTFNASGAITQNGT